MTPEHIATGRKGLAKARAALPQMTEAEFQRKVIGLAKDLGWEVMHVRRGRSSHLTPTSVAGWVDLVLWRDRVLFRELKRDGGKLKPDQEAVIASLTAAGADVAVWTPNDWTEILRTLT